MPHYEYHCGANGAVVEVRHGMSEALETWGDLCARAGIDPGDTAADAPVRRLMSLPVPTPGAGSSGDAGPQSCGPACACAGLN